MRQSISVLLVLALLLPLAACSAQKPPEQTLSGLQDPSLFRQQDRGEFFLETEDCYYYLYNRKIYFSSKKIVLIIGCPIRADDYTLFFEIRKINLIHILN